MIVLKIYLFWVREENTTYQTLIKTFKYWNWCFLFSFKNQPFQLEVNKSNKILHVRCQQSTITLYTKCGAISRNAFSYDLFGQSVLTAGHESKKNENNSFSVWINSKTAIYFKTYWRLFVQCTYTCMTYINSIHWNVKKCAFHFRGLIFKHNSNFFKSSCVANQDSFRV